MDQDYLIYQVWTTDHKVWRGGEWVDVKRDLHDRAMKQGCKVRKSNDGTVWTIPGPPYRIEDIGTT